MVFNWGCLPIAVKSSGLFKSPLKYSDNVLASCFFFKNRLLSLSLSLYNIDRYLACNTGIFKLSVSSSTLSIGASFLQASVISSIFKI